MSPRLARARPAAALAVALAAASAGCASLERASGYAVSPAAWRAGVARRGLDPADVPNPIDVTPAMTAAARRLAGTGDDLEKLARLRDAILVGPDFTFAYQRDSTFSAAEAFENRRGNCVSFTNLFIALGRSLGIRLHAALVSARGASEREGDLIVTYNHMVAVFATTGARTAKVYDFYRSAEPLEGRLVLLDDYAVAAIRASNDGIAHLHAGEGAEAVHDLEIAVKLAPGLGSVRANLGLAKWRAGDVPGAFETIRKGLEIEPRGAALLQNLAALYVEAGKPAEARAALSALDVARASPYLLIVRGDLDLRAGDAKSALRSYREAARLEPGLVDPWLAIARAELVRGRPDAARKAARKALKRDASNEEARLLLEAVP